MNWYIHQSPNSLVLIHFATHSPNEFHSIHSFSNFLLVSLSLSFSVHIFVFVFASLWNLRCYCCCWCYFFFFFYLIFSFVHYRRIDYEFGTFWKWVCENEQKERERDWEPVYRYTIEFTVCTQSVWMCNRILYLVFGVIHLDACKNVHVVVLNIINVWVTVATVLAAITKFARSILRSFIRSLSVCFAFRLIRWVYGLSTYVCGWSCSAR